MKNKYLLILLSITIGIIFGLPHIFGLYKSWLAYYPLQSTQGLSYQHDETYAYAPEVHQILNFRFSGDSYLWEYKNHSMIFMGEVASIAPIALISSLASVPLGFILSDLIFPPLLFLLVYSALRYQKFNSIFCLTTALAVICIPFLSLLIPKLFSYQTNIIGSVTDPLLLSRTPHPQISIIFLFASLFLTSVVLKKPNKKNLFLWSLSIGLSLYSSPFVASTVFFSMALLAPIIFKRLGKKAMAFSLAIGLLICLPWLINMISTQEFLKHSTLLLTRRCL